MQTLFASVYCISVIFMIFCHAFESKQRNTCIYMNIGVITVSSIDLSIREIRINLCNDFICNIRNHQSIIHYGEKLILFNVGVTYTSTSQRSTNSSLTHFVINCINSNVKRIYAVICHKIRRHGIIVNSSNNSWIYICRIIQLI